MEPTPQHATSPHAFLIAGTLLVGASVLIQIAVGREALPALPGIQWAAFGCGTAIYFAIACLRYPRGLPDLTMPRIASGLAFGAVAIFGLDTFSLAKMSIGHVRGFPLDAPLAALDGPLLSVIVDLPAWCLVVLDRIYPAWGLVAMGFTVWCAWTTHPVRDAARTAWVLSWCLIALLGGWLGASAGPALAGLPAYAPLVARLHALDLTSAHLQDRLLAAFASDAAIPYAGISAMPSMHVGGAAIMTLVARRVHRRAGLIATAYTGLIWIGSVALGWHYALDGLVGILGAVGCWRMAQAWRADAAMPVRPAVAVAFRIALLLLMVHTQACR